MKHTLPALIFSLFRLSAHLESGASQEMQAPVDEDAMQLVKVDQVKIFKNVNELIAALQEHQPLQCMKLYLQAC